MYGQRDYQYQIVALEYSSEGPEIYYPAPFQITIRLSENAEGNLDAAVYQLAHEVIHCLAPSGGVNANILEEGLAVYFSVLMIARKKLNWRVGMRCYQDALDLLEPIITNHPSFIKALRAVQPKLYELSPTDLTDLNIGISHNDAAKLTSKFVRYQ